MITRDINTQSSSENLLPLARVFRLKELPGLIGKRLEVPDGRIGLVIAANGTQRTFQPGRHTILSPLDRLVGKGVGLLVGYYSQQSLLVRLSFDNLLSGDGKTLEACLIGQVQISDPGRFLIEHVASQRTLNNNVLALEDRGLYDALRGFVRRYNAADLIFGLPTDQVVPKIQTILVPALNQIGMELHTLQLLSFQAAEDRIEIARNALDLMEQLQDVEIQKQMLLIENQVQLEDFIRQLDTDTVEKLGLRALISPQQLAVDDTPGKSLWAAIVETLNALADKGPELQSERRYFTLESLWQRFRGKPTKEKQNLNLHRQPERWWLPRTLWILFLLLVGVSLTRLLLWIGETVSWANRVEVLLGLWGFILIAVLESVKVLYERREELQEHVWAETGTTFLDNLTGNNRERMDQLVRQQCSQDLQNIQQTLNDLRSRLYINKQIDRALGVKVLEEQASSVQEAVNNPNFGRPPYAQDVKIRKQLFENMLDYDENLLVRASALVEDTKRLLQKHSEGTYNPDELSVLVERLDAFKIRFAARSNAMRAIPQDMDPFRRVD